MLILYMAIGAFILGGGLIVVTNSLYQQDRRTK